MNFLEIYCRKYSVVWTKQCIIQLWKQYWKDSNEKFNLIVLFVPYLVMTLIINSLKVFTNSYKRACNLVLILLCFQIYARMHWMYTCTTVNLFGNGTNPWKMPPRISKGNNEMDRYSECPWKLLFCFGIYNPIKATYTDF